MIPSKLWSFLSEYGMNGSGLNAINSDGNSRRVLRVARKLSEQAVISPPVVPIQMDNLIKPFKRVNVNSLAFLEGWTLFGSSELDLQNSISNLEAAYTHFEMTNSGNKTLENRIAMEC